MTRRAEPARPYGLSPCSISAQVLVLNNHDHAWRCLWRGGVGAQAHSTASPSMSANRVLATLHANSIKTALQLQSAAIRGVILNQRTKAYFIVSVYSDSSFLDSCSSMAFLTSLGKGQGLTLAAVSTQPGCLLTVYRCTRTHSLHPPPCRASLTLAASSSLAYGLGV